MAKKTTRNQKQAEQAARKRRHIRIIAGIIMVAAAAGLAFGGLFCIRKNKRHRKPHRIRQTMPTYSAVIILRCSPQTDRP